MPNLVGIGLSQVPTNSMLGGLAYQSPDHASIKDLDLKNLSQINSEIADTAVDIFIYDTSKDSDGGAWRKRTTHTSWYNETLNTTTRGSRREFPAVAVIVVESYKLTIYDGDDPDLPMWMVFNSPTTPSTDGQLTMLGANGDAMTSVSALNGIIAVGESTSYGGLVEIIFLSDTARRRRGGVSTNGTHGYWGSKFISTRNTGSGTARGYDNTLNTSSDRLVVDNLNDVAMTVLPNAPIDETTGLPIPTIAVATNAGVSIIKDDGTVVDYTHANSTYDVTSFVEFLSDTRVAYAWDDNITPRRLYITPITSADSANADLSSYPIEATGTVGYGNNTDNKSTGNYNGNLLGSDQSVVASMSDRHIAVGDGSDGLNLINVQTETGIHNSLFAFATTSYNTGWMHGNIKGAFLSDTDTTSRNAETENLITGQNHDYDTNTGENWTSQSSATATYSSTQGVGGSGAIAMTSSGGSNVYSSIQFTGLTDGVQYTLRFQGKTTDNSRNTSFNISTGIHNTGTNLQSGAHTFAANNTYEWVNRTFTANGTSIYLSVYAQQGGSGTLYLDEFYLLPTELDRSVNNNGLAVYGTITKSAVATGAELVAYSGFSNSNYLVQPYNSDMQTGTGAFSVTAWFKTTSTEENFEGLIYYNRSGSIGDGWQIMLEPNSDGKGLYFYVYGASANIATTAVDGLNNGVWHQVVVTHNNGSIQMFIDGTLRKSSSNPSIGSINDSQAKLHIGRWYGNANSSNYWWRGSIALARHSASIPSAEQVKKMYEDEKVLFQESAKCTLYGSSDAVTALAYDEVTEQLHVGTSSGRSDFQGLRRINNTTTAVTTAISAHDEFIVEQ